MAELGGGAPSRAACFRVDDAEVGAEPCRMLIAAWDGWRGEHLVPSRDAMNLADIKPLLPGLMILEAQSRDRVIFRLAGTAIDQVLGVSVTGQNYVQLARPGRRALRAERLARQLAQPCGARMVTRVALGKSASVPIEIVSLPLRPKDGRGPQQLIAAAGGVNARLMRNAPCKEPLLGGAEIYHYIDIGAGVPEQPDPQALLGQD